MWTSPDPSSADTNPPATTTPRCPSCGRGTTSSGRVYRSPMRSRPRNPFTWVPDVSGLPPTWIDGASAEDAMYRTPSNSYSPYSRSGCTATATLASSVHGVVVQITSWRFGSFSRGNETKTELVWTLSYPCASSCDDSAVPQRGQYGSTLYPR